MSVKPVPENFHTITPYVIVPGAAKFIEFTKKAFGAIELMRSALPDGAIMHAQIKIGDSIIMVSDTREGMEPITAMLYLYVPNVDEVYQTAIQAGGVVTMEVEDRFYGDRSGGLKDQFGNHWWVATHIKDVTDAELKQAATEQCKN